MIKENSRRNEWYFKTRFLKGQETFCQIYHRMKRRERRMEEGEKENLDYGRREKCQKWRVKIKHLFPSPKNTSTVIQHRE